MCDWAGRVDPSSWLVRFVRAKYTCLHEVIAKTAYKNWMCH